MQWAYGLDPGLSYHVGGNFWWYAYEDAFAGRGLLAGPLRSAFESEAAALSWMHVPRGWRSVPNVRVPTR